MKLIHKFTLWYLCIALVCTIVGTIITYHSVYNKIREASANRLEQVNAHVEKAIEAGHPIPAFLEGAGITVEKLQRLPANAKTTILRESVSNKTAPGNEIKLTVSSFTTVNGSYYRIQSVDYVTHAKQILSGIEASIAWKWGLILGLIGLTASIVSRIILGPFKKTLKAIGQFNIKQKESLELPVTNTREFAELNRFLQQMSEKAKEDYSSLKEFSENASHELQTPVAVMRGKLELLSEFDIRNEQAVLINDVQQSLEKLSRINHSLILLARLENHEFEAGEPIRFCRSINDAVAGYQELIEMKGLNLTKKVEKQVWVKLNPSLADLLLNNLISNAIRHNSGEGLITVTLNRGSLKISNTGPTPENGTEEYFDRFKKGNQCSQSIGIGLAIVKQICELNQFPIQYTFENGWHTIQIMFPVEPIPVSSLASQETEIPEKNTHFRPSFQ